MKYEDFIKKDEKVDGCGVKTTPEENYLDVQKEEDSSVELDVQKAVVESLAADKIQQNVEIEKLNNENRDLIKKNNELISKVTDLTATIGEMRDQLKKVGDLLAKNSELAKSNQVTLLERNPEIEDHFEGETHDHLLEVIKEARDESEATGRTRRAQLLESVLVANEICGTLLKKREQLKKLFLDNQNVINGQVINELDKLNINYKIGDKYLLVDEIIKRSY